MSLNNKEIRNPIFICGCHRTGTTLLQTILSAHSEVDILPETKLYAWLWKPFGGLPSADSEKLLREIQTLMPFVNRAWALPENSERLKGLRASLPPVSGFANIGDVMEHLLRHSAKSTPNVGEKSPLHIYHLDAIISKFPTAKILITERDLRGAFYSQMMRSKRKKLSHRDFKLFNFVTSWTNAVRLARLSAAKNGPERIKLVKFESLVESPQETIGAVCEFLGIKYQDSMDSIHFENSSFQNVGRQAGIDASTADRWRDELGAELAGRLNYIAEQELKISGCDLQSKSPVVADRFVKQIVRVANTVAVRNPPLVCYFGRDPRYRNLQRQFRSHEISNTLPKVFVFGNHKSGTTAIAKLLAASSGLSSTIDFPRSIRRDGYALVKGAMTFDDIANRHPKLFCRELVKIPALSFVAQDVLQRFPDSKAVWVVRDPRDNIRSILNRRKIPGDQKTIPGWNNWWMKLQNKPSMDADIWGGSEHGYIGVLAQRWNRAIQILNEVESDLHIVRYEDFVQSKQQTIEDLAEQLELTCKHQIDALLDVQFQPAGNRDIDWAKFFGSENLTVVETICAAGMRQFGYQTTG